MKKLFIVFIFMVCGTCVSHAAGVTAIESFDSGKYLGKWYEIARLPNRFEEKCLIPITATYSSNPDDSNKIVVVNECNTKDNTSDVAEGMASFVESDTIGKLTVTFLPKFIRWLPFGHGDYWILSVDYEKLSLVGSPDHKYLWILSRSDVVAESDVNALLIVAQDQGFDTSKLIYNHQPVR